MEQYKNYKTEDYLEDVSFIQWVINPTDELEKHWKGIIAEYPEQKKAIEKAILFVKSAKVTPKKIPIEEKKRMWSEIQSEIKSHNENEKQNIKILKIAASIAILLSVSFFLYQLSRKGDAINYAEIIETVSKGENTKVILADDSKIDIQEKESTIEYDENGMLVLDEERIVGNTNSKNGKADKEIAMNQIIVPRGKRANISFSDGTKLWLNSGSHAIYPVAFSDSKREIYLEGEAYLEVAKDKNKPFFVKTKSMSVRVLGTSFNVKAYAEDDESSVVLVEGAVEIKGNKRKTRLDPNQKFEYNKQTDKSEVTKDVNVLEYIGWKDGWLLCNSESLKSVFKKLEMYYDVDIEVKDPSVENYKTSGKLELKDSIKNVLEVISITVPIKYIVEKNSIYMYNRKMNAN